MDTLPDWIWPVLAVLCLVILISWIIFPVLVFIGLDRIRRVLLQIRDRDGVEVVQPKEQTVPAPPPRAVITATHRDAYGRTTGH